MHRGVWTTLGLILLLLQRPASPVGWQALEIHDGAVILRSSTAASRLSVSGHLQPLLARSDQSFLDLSRDRPHPQVVIDNVALPDARLDIQNARPTPAIAFKSSSGMAIRVLGRGSGPLAELTKSLHVELHDDTPDITFFQATYRNTGSKPLLVNRIDLLRWHLDADAGADVKEKGPLWSFHGSAELSREKALARLEPGFARENRMGVMTEKGRGGGLPLAAFWTSTGGWALGLAETTPRIFSLPVRVQENGQVEIAIVLRPTRSLEADEAYTTPLMFVAAFQGDFHEALSAWRQALVRRGLRLPAFPDGSYAPNWCSWGFGRRITSEWMLNALPKVKQLGFGWVTLDDGWFDRVGDYDPRSTFGVEGLRRVVKASHEQGLKIQLWWLPLATEDGSLRWDGRRQKIARIAEDHPEWLILDASGRRARTFSQLALMCPAVPAVQRYHRVLARRFLDQWGFDGLKIDKIYAVPPCHNPAHDHRYPEESVERMGDVFHAIFAEAQSVRPGSVVQICPCAALPNLAWFPYMNQAVTADPANSAEVRWRTKMYKALFGPSAPVFADHVELTQTLRQGARLLTIGRDFASAVGVGAVPGTRFVWPPSAGFEDVNLTHDKEKHFKRWLTLYESKRLSEGEFRNLYVHGIDRPEGYVISKNGRMYYAFYSDDDAKDPRSGPIELRGLASERYRVVDYESGRELGVVNGPVARIDVRIENHLLLEATPF